jgi:uncharacterized protein YndB with AHSA1/START domain
MPLQTPPLEASVEIAAAPETVWKLISDVRQLRRFSPQVLRTVALGDPAKPGTVLVNLNHRGLLLWPTRAKIVEYAPGKRLAFRILENGTTWSYTLEPTTTGTRLIERRDAERGIADISVKLTERFMGGTEAFSAEMQHGMQQTLAKIKTAAESGR